MKVNITISDLRNAHKEEGNSEGNLFDPLPFEHSVDFWMDWEALCTALRLNCRISKQVHPIHAKNV